MHAQTGILIAKGPDINRDQQIPPARIVDLTPTILHLMGLPVPVDMDGRVLNEIFTKNSDPETREVDYTVSPSETSQEDLPSEETRSPQEEAELESRLRDLGYL
jgi:arylsulfatase A-like enzyme